MNRLLRSIVLFSFCLIANMYLHGANNSINKNSVNKKGTSQKTSDIDTEVTKRLNLIEICKNRIQYNETKIKILNSVYVKAAQFLDDEGCKQKC